ncbi:MAG: class C sortase [Acutalibacteraceae bacterium]
MKKAILWTIGILLLLISLGLISYPFISSYLMSLNSESAVMSYLDSAEKLSDDKQSEMLNAARKYNESLIGSVSVGDPFASSEDLAEDYNALLSIDGSPIMASIEIPSINVNLAIYHGTNDEILQKGVGHLSSSSLPVGGKNTHAVLTGHSGLSSQKMFSDIASLENGDRIYIHVLGETLAYEVSEINTVLPSDTEKLQIVPDKDLITLVTCTPFGINSHRLLVTGKRVPYTEGEEQKVSNAQKRESAWSNEYINALILGFIVMAAILTVFGLVKLVLYICRKRKANDKKNP